MKKVLVCGQRGFMGSNIFKYLMKRPDLMVVGESTDLLNAEAVNYMFSISKPDIVIQAAAVTSGSKDIVERPYIHVTDNAIMNSIILRACYEHKVKHFIFLSCGVMYQPGDTPREESDFNESEAIFPSYFGVGWTKVYIEKMCEFFSRQGVTKHTVIRHSNTYGPGDKFDLEKGHVVGATIKKVMDAKDGDTITVWGNGTETARDLVYVDDVCDFIDLVIDKQSWEFDIFNIGLGKALTVLDIVNTIISASGKKLSIAFDTSKPSIPTKLVFDDSRAWMLGKRFVTPFEEGIKKTIDWYKANIK